MNPNEDVIRHRHGGSLRKGCIQTAKLRDLEGLTRH